MEKAIVLVVEDEAITRLGTFQTLEEAGFAVVDACDADDAIVILEERNDIDAVVTDLKMPGSRDGLELVHSIRDWWPSIRLVVASELDAPTEVHLPKLARFINKPYAPNHLLKILHELFGPNPAPYRYSGDMIQDDNAAAHPSPDCLTSLRDYVNDAR